MIHRKHFWQFSGVFISLFLKALAALSPIFLALLLMIIGLGILQAYLLEVSVGDGIYFSWVTAFTVGYGDLVPNGWFSRVAAMGTALIGMVFTGLWVAVAVNALKMTVTELDMDS